MAYRRKQGNPRSSTYEVLRSPIVAEDPSSLAAQAIRASAAHRDSSLYSTARRRSPPPSAHPNDYSSSNTFDEPRSGFWGVLARKAKSIIDDDRAAHQFQSSLGKSNDHQLHHSDRSSESHWKSENPTIQNRLDAITSSLNNISGKVGNALEEGFSVVENRTAHIIQETRKLNIRRKANGPTIQNPITDASGFLKMQTDYETQLKASRDVANAMAAKAKLLMRELKTVKADLAFAKERCSQLEEENKILREGHERGDHPEDDDLVRLQLESLLAEKARLANENSIYARENRFLREIVEYHQLTMQDVIYLNEGIEEVTEVYQIPSTLSHDTSRSPSPSVHEPSKSQPDSEQRSVAPEESPHVSLLADCSPAIPASQEHVSGQSLGTLTQ